MKSYRRLLRSLTMLIAILAVPTVAKANFSFAVQQDVSALFGSGSPPAPFYLAFTLNSADNGGANNVAYVHYNLGLSKNVSLVGTSTVDNGTATGNLTGGNLLTMFEGGTAKLGDYTRVLQKISVDASQAAIGFQVEVTQNFTGPSNLYAPDTFTYQLLYDDPNNPGTLIPVVTNLAPGNIDFINYSYLPNTSSNDVKNAGPLAGFNPSPLDGIGTAFVVPEPTTLLIWSAMVAGLGACRLRRRSVSL